MDLTQNYYELFGLPKAFLVDQHLLADKYRQLQREFHPDKFAGKSASEQRLSVQFTSLLNNAYQTLKSPLLSAEYLLDLSNGAALDREKLTISDGVFLMKQMEWREQLADLSEDFKRQHVDISQQLEQLREETENEKHTLIAAFANSYEADEFPQAKEIVAKLHFVEKMLTNIDQLEDSCLS